MHPSLVMLQESFSPLTMEAHTAKRLSTTFFANCCSHATFRMGVEEEARGSMICVIPKLSISRRAGTDKGQTG